MTKTTVGDTIIVIDDELQNVLWMFDYLESKGFTMLVASTVNEAIDLVEPEIYRALVVDLNIPVLPPYEDLVLALGPVYGKFPGLYVARRARNIGYRDRQVIIYSVHRDAEVNEEAKKLGCTYIIKGRPREIKAELESVVSFDPTASDD